MSDFNITEAPKIEALGKVQSDDNGSPLCQVCGGRAAMYERLSDDRVHIIAYCDLCEGLIQSTTG